MAGANKLVSGEDIQTAKDNIAPIKKGNLVDVDKTGSTILNIQRPRRKKPVNLFSGSKYEIRI